jgi:hypothetical protein
MEGFLSSDVTPERLRRIEEALDYICWRLGTTDLREDVRSLLTTGDFRTETMKYLAGKSAVDALREAADEEELS